MLLYRPLLDGSLAKMACDFTQKLQNLVGSDIRIRINDNISTMLHVQWKKNATHLSMHRMFLKAPYTIQRAIASYVRQRCEKVSPAVSAYIDKHVATLDHTHVVAPEKLKTRGTAYDLKKLYNRINRRYFAGSLDLSITWFGSPKGKVRSKCTLGVYHGYINLVKIHRLLDNPRIPEYVLEYVIYHEMVHAAVPPYRDETGRNCIHSKEFKALERKFEKFKEANLWIDQHNEKFFISEKVKSHGRT